MANLMQSAAWARLIPCAGDGEKLVYSTEQNLTYVENVGLFNLQSETYAGPYPSLVDEIIDQVGSVDGVALAADHFDAVNGTMRWYGAKAWVQWLNMQHYAGGSTWRLWRADPDCGGRPADPDPNACPNGELGYLYYIEGGLVNTTYDTPIPSQGEGWIGDPPGVLTKYFTGLNLFSAFWAENNENTYGWARWTINQGGRQLAYNYVDQNIQNYFFAWPVQEGFLGNEVSIFKSGFDDPDQP